MTREELRKEIGKITYTTRSTERIMKLVDDFVNGKEGQQETTYVEGEGERPLPKTTLLQCLEKAEKLRGQIDREIQWLRNEYSKRAFSIIAEITKTKEVGE